MPKTFTVTGANGAKIEAEQIATFAHYVQNIQFRFVVTRVPGAAEMAVTERTSGKSACKLPVMTLQSDALEAGKKALDALIAKHGAPRVRSVLAGG